MAHHVTDFQLSSKDRVYIKKVDRLDLKYMMRDACNDVSWGYCQDQAAEVIVCRCHGRLSISWARFWTIEADGETGVTKISTNVIYPGTLRYLTIHQLT